MIAGDFVVVSMVFVCMVLLCGLRTRCWVFYLVGLMPWDFGLVFFYWFCGCYYVCLCAVYVCIL